LIVGESGTSKSTILMEIIYDYYDQGYEILWNRDDASMKEGIPIINFIKDLLKNDGSKVLVAVDNVNDERTSAIFYVMDQIY
jgi:ABC-type oligopeptide transport system ATPase subunit